MFYFRKVTLVILLYIVFQINTGFAQGGIG